MDDDGIRVTADASGDGIRVWAGPREQTVVSGPVNLPNMALHVDSSWKLSKSLIKCFSVGSQTKPIYDLSSSILSSNKLRQKFKQTDFDKVSAFRKGVDCYTHQPVSNITKPAIDHIVEIQCLSYCVAKVLHSQERIVVKCTDVLRPHINIMDNFNVTSWQINAAKMNVFRTFIRDKIDHGLPLLSLMIGTTCEKHMHGIKEAFEDSFQQVQESMSNIDHCNNLSISGALSDIIEEFQSFYFLLKFDDKDYYRK